MRWEAKPEFLYPVHFEIIFDSSVGFYLYVYDKEKCIKDYLQDTFEVAVQSALEDFGVPKNEWKKIK